MARMLFRTMGLRTAAVGLTVTGLALCAMSTVPGCRSRSDRQLNDTEGRRVSAQCEPSGECTLTKLVGPARSDEKTALTLSRAGHLVGLCDVAPGQSPASPADCRALVCQADEDCPPAHGLKNGQCLNSLCTEPAQALIPEDAVMLCLAGTGLGNGRPAQVERYALGLNCGAPCKVPAPCRQP